MSGESVKQCYSEDPHSTHLWSTGGEALEWFRCGGRRSSWDEVFMSVAFEMSKRSRCSLAQVGAVIVDVENRIVSTGYNGPPRHFPIEGDNRCIEFCPRAQGAARGLSYGLGCVSIHAEANALMFADRRTYEGGTLYVNRACCADCTKLIANSGVHRVVMRVIDDDAHRKWGENVLFLTKCDIIVTVIDESTPET